MKQIIITSLLIILIPYMIVTFFIQENNIIVPNEKTKSDINVRVKKVDGAIMSVNFEDYIVGVLAGEMPVSFELEALKAQAVAARSYVLKKMENNNKEYDILDTVMNQVYLDENTLKNKWQNDYENRINKLKEAVNSTKGQYLSYNNEIVEAFFFSTSTGYTENVEEVFSESLPYLRSVESKWDEGVSPVFSESTTFSFNDFYNKLGLTYQDNLTFEILDTTSTGRVKKIKVNGVEFKGSDFANKLGIKSNFFTITKLESNILITTKGYGHGVGMSQYGAQAMALQGYKYDQILKHYYQGIEIKKI